ncbi:MAG: phosphatidylserine decarboxylase [Ruminococcus sp.]|nr:phosphatidylserine decarboxylase [Ruminococcus sp.]
MKKESCIIRFLYRTCIGRAILKIIICPKFSKIVSHYLNSSFSKWLIKRYIKKYNMNMDEYETVEYTSFNNFFIRCRKNNFFDEEPENLISPCDGYLSVYKIDSDCNLKIKHSDYTIQSLLQDEILSKKYQNGICMVFRLEPHNYHRYIYIDNCTVEKEVRIAGVLHCVRPVACEKFPVYVENSREYALLNTEHFGSIIQMEIGALLVGKIKNYHDLNNVSRGQEKGYFEFGGSTIVLLFEKDMIIPNDDIIRNTEFGIETPVKAGTQVGVSKLK